MRYLKQEFYQILKSDEDFFDFIQLNAFDGLWFWNLEKAGDKWLNPKFCSLLGYEREELKGNQINKIFHREDLDKALNIFEKYKKSNTNTYEDDIRFVHKTGKVLWVRMKALIFGKSGNGNHRVVVTHTDITQEHEQEREIIRTLNRYESILNSHSTFIIRTDLQGNYTYVNDYFCKCLNLVREDIINRNSMTAIVETDRHKCLEAVKTCLAAPNESVFVRLRKYLFDKEKNEFTDEFIYTDWEYISILDEQGSISEIQCVGIEVTQKVEAEQELEATKNLLQTCNEAVTTGIWHTDLVNKKIFWDKVTKQIHEVSPDYQSDTTNGFKFEHYTPEYKEIAKGLVDKAINEGISFDEELQIVTEKGNKKWVRAIGIPVFENQTCIELYGTCQDITVQKELELKLKNKVKELEKTHQELTHAQKLLETTNKAAQIGIWELNFDDFTTTWDKITKDIHEVEGDFVSDPENGIAFYKEGNSRQIITKVFTRALEEGVPFDEQLKIITAKGNEIWVRAIGIPTMKDGKCVELYGTFQNIDKQKKNEIMLQEKLEELKTSQKELLHTSTLLETCNASATIGTWKYDINSRDIGWDNIVHSIYALPKGVDLDTTSKINFFKKGKNRDIVIDVIKKAREEGQPFDEELELINFRRQHKWVRIIGIPQMENGKCVELYGTLQDITEKKNTELALQEKVKELEKSQQEVERIQSKLTMILEKTGIGLWELNLATGGSFWDEQAYKLFHETKETFTPEKWQEKIHPADLEYIFQNINDFAENKTDIFDIKYRMNQKDGIYYYHSRGVLVEENNEKRISGIVQDITKQKLSKLELQQKLHELEEAQKEIKKIQTKLTITLEKTGIGMWEIDLVNNKTYWDNQAKKILGISQDEEMTAEIAAQRVNADDLKKGNQMIEDLVLQKIPQYQVIYRTKPIDGKINYHESKAILIKNEEGQPISIFGITQDITQQKKSEYELQKNIDELKIAKEENQKIQERLTLTLEKTGIGLWEFDLITKQPYWDKQTKKIFGLDPNQEINAEMTAQRMHSEDLEKVNQMIEDLATQKISQYHAIYRTVPIDGKTRYHESKAILIKNEEGEPAFVLGVTQDITKQKEYEKIIEEQNKDLASSEKQLRKGIREMYHLQQDLAKQKQQLEQIFDAVPAMIYQFKRDNKGNVSFPLVSKGSELILGVNPKDILNNSSNNIFESIHPKDLLGFQSAINYSVDTMQQWESELRLMKDGKEMWIHATSKPTQIGDGGVIWTGIMQNIDQLKATEQKIQEQNTQLQEALKELRETQSQLIHNEKMTTLGQLVASIAHEIN
ncbi:PAS domain-containing protein, partial [Bernardetia sp.]|uniref:PAS domain-containing protein n=1 Tax=Bernardetia sp. TaxID=1937974 RepID=UPI0025C42806